MRRRTLQSDGRPRSRAGAAALPRSPEPARAAHPVRRKLADLLCHIRHHSGDGVVVASLDPHDTRVLRCPEPHREHRPEHDRHLSEDIARLTLAEDALDPVDQPDRLDATFEHGEQRALSALVRCVLARHEPDIRRHSGKPLALGQVETRKERDTTDLLGRHHVWHSRRGTGGAVALPTALRAPESVFMATAQRYSAWAWPAPAGQVNMRDMSDPSRHVLSSAPGLPGFRPRPAEADSGGSDCFQEGLDRRTLGVRCAGRGEDGPVHGSLGDGPHDDARMNLRSGATSSGSRVTAWPPATRARLVTLSLVRWRMSGVEPSELAAGAFGHRLPRRPADDPWSMPRPPARPSARRGGDAAQPDGPRAATR